MSSSSAAAIPRPTASARRSARARSASPSSTSARSRRRRKTSSRSGPTGRPRCAPRPRRPKARSASSRWRRSNSSARTAQLTGVKCCEVDERRKPIAGTEFVIRADLAFIAIGFAGPISDGVAKELDGKLKLVTDSRRSINVAANDRDYRTSVDRLWAAGDVRRGQSLVVWAIREGRQAARAIDEALMGSTVLPE